jgi:hypothetical protein
MTMNWVRFVRKRYGLIDTLSLLLPEVIEENHGKRQSE